MRPTFARVPRGLVEDPDFIALPDQGRALYLWAWTSSSAHWCGLFRFDAATVAVQLRRTVDWVAVGLVALVEAELVWHDSAVLYVPGIVEAFPPDNPNMLRAALQHALGMPKTHLRAMWATDIRALVPDGWMAKDIAQALSNLRRDSAITRAAATGAVAVEAPTIARSEPPAPAPTPALVPAPPTGRPSVAAALASGPDRNATARADGDGGAGSPTAQSGRREALLAEARAALSGWNDWTGQRLRAHALLTTASARLREGFCVADLVLVAEWAVHGPRADFFRGENERQTSYLTPATLWRPTKFALYLQQARQWKGLDRSASDNRDTAAAEFVRSRLAELPAQEQDDNGDEDVW